MDLNAFLLKATILNDSEVIRKASICQCALSRRPITMNIVAHGCKKYVID